MVSLFFGLTVSTLLVAAPPLPAGTQLKFEGSVQRRSDAPAADRKSFDLTLWIMKSDESTADLLWLVEERGRGEWPWLERCGTLQLQDGWKTPAGAAGGPTVLYDRGEGRSVVPILAPFYLLDDKLEANETWKEEPLEYTVEKATKRGEHNTWQVAVRDQYGPKRTLWLDQASPVIAALTERVIMGRGDEYELHLDWLGREQLDAEALDKLKAASTMLLGLRGKVSQPARSQEIEWKPKQLEVLRTQVPQLVIAAAGTPLEKLASAAQRDLGVQAGRTDAVSQLGNERVGQKVAEFGVTGASGEKLAAADLQGKVTVLHFWDYRDEPLKEPYGQVGYLDFIHQRRQAAGLKVWGVAVDGRLADEKTRGAALRSVRKLKSFMNLSYPVLLDSGLLLKQFGDPRLVGANLPLFVVIGPDGKVLHYHVGHYEIQRDRGLAELDEVVGSALEKAGSGKK